MKRIISILLAVILLGGCAAPAQPAESAAEEKVTIAVLLKAMGNPHWQEMRAGILDAAAALGADIILLYPESEAHTRQQTMIFQDILAQQPDALLWAPCDSTLGPEMKALADKAGVPLFTVDTRADGVNLPYIGADNPLLGRMAAQYMAESALFRGKFAVIAGSENQLCHVDRAEGFVEGMSIHPGIEVVDVSYVPSSFDAAMEMTGILLDKYPDLTGIFCTSAVMGLGAVEQIKARFRLNYVSIVTMDTQTDAISAVSSGLLSALVTQDGYEAGYLAVDAVMKSLDGKPIEDNIYLSAELLTRRNVDAFMEQYLLRRNAHD